MTVSETARRGTEFVIAADGSYAARLVPSGQEAGGGTRATGVESGGTGAALAVERWTLDGPEPYAVPLPGARPEAPGTQVLPMSDGRVLVHRPSAAMHLFALLYPTGPSTGELPLGAVECVRADGTPGQLSLLPPPPVPGLAYALAPGLHSTSVWLVAGGAFGPEHIAEIPGHCTGGVWLDRGGRILAVDRTGEDGVTKAVAVDLERGGELSPLLQIAESSNDRLLLADVDSGLLLIRSDAPGEDRLAWGVLGSALPVRFPECLAGAGNTLTPFAIQPGQDLLPEHCAVGFRVDGAAGGSWVGVWRPAGRRLHQLPAPRGWLTGAGRWTREGVLRLPYATPETPCGIARVTWPSDSDTGEVPLTGAARAAATEGSTAGPGAPEAATPEGVMPEGVMPGAMTPGAMTPGGATPEGMTPGAATPEVAGAEDGAARGEAPTHDRGADLDDTATRPLHRNTRASATPEPAPAEPAPAGLRPREPGPVAPGQPGQPGQPAPTEPGPAAGFGPAPVALSVTAVSGFAGVAGPSTLASGLGVAGAAIRAGLIVAESGSRTGPGSGSGSVSEPPAPSAYLHPHESVRAPDRPAPQSPAPTTGITWTTEPPNGPGPTRPVPLREAPFTG